MKRLFSVIVTAIILFCFPVISLAQENKKEGENLIEKFLGVKEAEASVVVPQNGNLITDVYNSCWEFYEKIHSWKIEDFFEEKNIILSEPIYFRIWEKIDLSYRKDKILDLTKEEFVAGFSWKNKKNKNLLLGVEAGADKEGGFEVLAGFKIKF